MKGPLGNDSAQLQPKRDFYAGLTRLSYGVLALFLFAIVYFNVASALGTLPGFCGLCHRSSLSSWHSSAHGDVKCNACHSGADAFAVVAGRINLAQMIPAQLTGLYRAPATTIVPSKRCLVCHEDILRKTSKVGELRVSHKEIAEGGYECDDCHSAVVHGKAAVRQNVPEMDKCLVCHNGMSASKKCEECHTQRTINDAPTRITGPWQITHGSNWRKMHGMGNLSTCQSCHSKLYCSRCHQIALPHPGAWLSTHGQEIRAAPKIKQGCSLCHQGALCKNCHTLQMPHPANFLQQHSKIVKKDGRERCLNCHLEEACDRCHSYHRHPGIPQNKLKVLRKGAGLN